MPKTSGIAANEIAIATPLNLSKLLDEEATEISFLSFMFQIKVFTNF